MCLAIYKPKGAQITKQHLKNGFKQNDDGAGFAVAVNGSIQIHKGFFTFGDFWKSFNQFQNEAMVIHFRFATHGKVGKENCHPFELCGGKFAMVHNGILNISSDEERSDTHNFAHLVLEPIIEKIDPACPALSFLVEQNIGSGNKIAVLRQDGSATIYNEKSGQWHNGAWFSNGCFKQSNHWFDDDWYQPRKQTDPFPDYMANRSKREELDAMADFEYYLSQGMTNQEAAVAAGLSEV